MEGLIFSNIINKITDSAQGVSNIIENKDLYNNNIYDIISKLPKYNIIIYIIIIFIIYNFVGRLEIRLNEILVWIICIVLIYILLKKDYTQFIKYTISKKIQLNFLHKIMFEDYTWSYETESNLLVKPISQDNKSYLYLNPVLIEFFYNIREYSQYNQSSYVHCLLHCNNVIGFDYQSKIGLSFEYSNYQVAIEEKNKALNELNTIIYSLPNSLIAYNKFKDSVNILHQILNKHIENMAILFKNNNRITEINLYSMPDNFYDSNFFISSNDTETRDFKPIFNVY